MEIDCKDPNRYFFILKAQHQSLCHSLTSSAFDKNQIFAYQYKESFQSQITTDSHLNDGWNVYSPTNEFERQNLTLNNHWRLSMINKTYKLCPSYPKKLIVPKEIDDKTLEAVGSFRSKGRIPVLCYLHVNGNSISRASQPKVGLQNRRSAEDEELINQIRLINDLNKLTLYDARPRINAIANHAKGAGTEDIVKAYSGCQLKFLDIDNIHAIRNSFRALKELCLAIDKNENFSSFSSNSTRSSSKELDKYSENDYWHTALASTHWFEYIHLILRGSVKIVQSITVDNASVFIHCSDGWFVFFHFPFLSRIWEFLLFFQCFFFLIFIISPFWCKLTFNSIIISSLPLGIILE